MELRDWVLVPRFSNFTRNRNIDWQLRSEMKKKRFVRFPVNPFSVSYIYKPNKYKHKFNKNNSTIELILNNIIKELHCFSQKGRKPVKKTQLSLGSPLSQRIFQQVQIKSNPIMAPPSRPLSTPDRSLQSCFASNVELRSNESRVIFIRMSSAQSSWFLD